MCGLLKEPTTPLLKSLLTIELLVLLSKNLSLSDRSNLATQNKTGLVLVENPEKECRQIVKSDFLYLIVDIGKRWKITFNVCRVKFYGAH